MQNNSSVPQNQDSSQPTKKIIISQSRIAPVTYTQTSSPYSEYQQRSQIRVQSPIRNTPYTINNDNLRRSPFPENIQTSTTFVNTPSHFRQSNFHLETHTTPRFNNTQSNKNITISSESILSDQDRRIGGRTPDRVYKPLENAYVSHQEYRPSTIQKSVILNQKATAEDISKLVQSKNNQQNDQSYANLTKEELIFKLQNSDKTIQELRNLISSLKFDGSENEKNANFARQIQSLTNEITGLKEQIYKLKNLANDDLVILEKEVTTEVYGKKSQIAIELDAAKLLKVEYEKLKSQLEEKEVRIHTFETQVIEMKTVIDRTNNQLTETQRQSDDVRNRSYYQFEMDKLQKDLSFKTTLLQNKENELSQEKSKANFYFQQKENLQREFDQLRNNSMNISQFNSLRSELETKQNEIASLNDRLSRQAPVKIEKVIPQDLKQNMEQLKLANLQKDAQISSMVNELNFHKTKLSEMESLNADYHQQVLTLQSSLNNLRLQSERDINNLKESKREGQFTNAERLKLNQENEKLQRSLADAERKIDELEASINNKNANIRQLNDDIRNKASSDIVCGLKDQISRLESLLEAKNIQISDLDKIGSQKIDPRVFNDLQNAKSRLEMQLNSIEKTYSDKEEMMRSQIHHFQSELAPLKLRLSEFDSIVRDKNKVIDDQTREYQKLKEDITNFKNLDFNKIDFNKIPSELNGILIEQQKKKLDEYKSIIDKYQKDIETLNMELNTLNAHNPNDVGFLKSQLEKSQRTIDRVNQELLIANNKLAQSEQEVRELAEKLNRTLREMELQSLNNQKSTSKNVEFVDSKWKEPHLKIKELTAMLEKEVEESNSLANLNRVWETKIDQLKAQIQETENQKTGFKKDLERLQADLLKLKNDHNDLQKERNKLLENESKTSDLEKQAKEKLLEKIRDLFSDRSIQNSFFRNANEKSLGRLIDDILEQILQDKEKERENENIKKNKPFLKTQGIQTDYVNFSTNREENDVSNIRKASGFFESKEEKNTFLKNLDDIKTQLNEQLKANVLLDNKNGDMNREIERLKQKVTTLKEEKSKSTFVNERYTRESEFVKKGPYDQGYAVEDSGLKHLLDENQKLKHENAELSERLTIFKDRVVKKKKAILNEISNFVNTKNGFETSLSNEINRNQEINVVINEREDFYQQY